jgi:uncharacterized protein involved in exopolysaccharide biosynthesis
MFAVFGAVAGLGLAVAGKPVYMSSATFIPQGTESGMSGLALAASQFGIRVPSTGTPWTAPVYAELLKSRVLLERIAVDTITVAELGPRPIPVEDLLRVRGETAAERVDRTVRALGQMVRAREVRTLSAVRLSVLSPWPSVSRSIADRLITAVNEFNLRTSQSQASAERQFVELQLQGAERELRASEDRLLTFRQRNRIIASPELMADLERLQREVTLRMQVYTSLVQARDDARVREVRNTPVMTIIEAPNTPVRSEPRKPVQKAVLLALAGALVGVLTVLISDRWTAARRFGGPREQEFFQLVDAATPRIFRRRFRSSHRS